MHFYLRPNNCTIKRSNNILREFKRTVEKMLHEVYPDWDDEKIATEKKLLNFHALRYTFATELISLKTDIKTVQKVMGYADIQTTLIIYAQYCHENAEIAIDKLPW